VSLLKINPKLSDHIVAISVKDTHIFPVLEPYEHTLSEACKCHPVQDIDEETGHVSWIHIPLNNDHLIDRLNVL
jgi:hypothetical protein